jgi:2'-5' RNA ligase
MATDEQIITYWICPAEPARDQLASIIRDLAQRFDAPAFEPHVTIYSADAASEKPEEALRKVVKSRIPYALSVRGLDFSDEFTKTLFVQFAPDSALTELSEDLRRASAAPSDYELNPHVSLIYKEMDEETKRRLATSITLPFDEVVFDTVKAVLSPAEIKSRKEVEAWRVVAEQKLTE